MPSIAAFDGTRRLARRPPQPRISLWRDDRDLFYSVSLYCARRRFNSRFSSMVTFAYAGPP